MKAAEKNGDKVMATKLRLSKPHEDYYYRRESAHAKARREKKRNSYVRVQEDLVEPVSFDCPFG